MPDEPNNQKSQYLKREEVRTMEKDMARLRERESEIAREKIAQIKTEEEAGLEAQRLEQAKIAAQERERAEAEVKAREEELERLREEAALKEGEPRSEESEREERESLRARLKEAQSKEDEERRKFLEDVARQAGEEVPIPPAPPAPLLPADVSAEAPEAKAEVPPSETKEGKKTFKFPKLPLIQLPKVQLPKVQIPNIPIPKITGYFPAKSSIFEKIWIRIIVSLFILAILATLVTFWYWYLIVREKPLEATAPEKKVEEIIVKKEIIAPLTLIPVESVELLETTTFAELPDLLTQILQKDFGKNKFTRLLIKNTAESRFLGLKDFFDAFQIKTPENFSGNVNDDFTLFIFSTPIKNQLGLIAKTQNPAVLRSVLNLWEQTLERDTDGFFTVLGKEGVRSSLFQKSTYKNTAIRCLSFTEENFGICWAVTDNYFIFTSSGESIVRTIDKIKE